MNEEKYQVQIPANVKVRTELINGIGIKELITTGIVGIICLAIDVPIYLISQNYLICLIFYTAKAYLSSRFMKNKEKIKGEIFCIFSA